MPECYDPQSLLNVASFRGIEFNCFRAEDTFGQRGPNHEYPDKQQGYAEFLGRHLEKYRVDGYFNGPDHVRLARSLRAAANVPSPGTLVHPWLGTLRVKVESLTIQHDQEEMLGETRFTLDCVEAGSLSFPVGVQAFGFGVFSAVEGIRSTIETVFNATFSTATLPTYLTAESIQASSEAAGEIAEAFTGLIEWNQETIDIYDPLVSLRDAPFNPVRPVNVILQDAITSVGVDYREGRKELAVERLERIARFRPTFESTQSTSPRADDVNRNINMVILTTRVSAIAELARLVFEDDTYFKSYSEALAWFDNIRELAGQELAIAVQECNQDVYDAIAELINEVSDAIDKLAPRLPSRQIISTCQPLPSLLAAYKAYGSIEKVCDLEEANPSASTFWLPPQLEVIE